jgi:hypothetical protein
MIAAWRLLSRRDLDDDSVAAPAPSARRRRGWRKESADA